MTKTGPAASDDSARFASADSLRAAHSELLKRFRANGNTPEMVAEVEAFIRRGKATGALLDADSDRWAAQSQLDYWATQLYRPGYEPPDPALDEFDPQLAPELDDSLCPYMGLDAFHESNQNVFFGRQRLVGELIGRLKTVRFLAVLGSSGSGKSSVVRAGLISALKEGALPGSADWTYCLPIVPGSNPLANLARWVLPTDTSAEQIQIEVDLLQKDPAHLAKTLSERFSNNVVLVVDQFEEVFTLCTDEVARHCFADNLIGLCQMPNAQHRVIITMRADFEANIARLPNVQALFEQNVARIPSFNASELREAIEAPAALIGLKFEEGVVDALLNDTLGEPAALPLLQFTLFKLWKSRDRNRVTWEAYKKLGGGRHALASSADEFYNQLIPEEQVTMRRILLKMVRPGEGLEVTSNRVPRAALYQKAEANDRIDRVLNKLIQSRLVRISEGDTAADEQVEIAHEALVRNWPRLVEWLEEERVSLRQRQRLTTAAEEWQRLGRDTSALWRGLVLNEARRYDDLNGLETEFVAAGYAAEQNEAQRKSEEAQRQQELEYAQKLAETEKARAEEQGRSATQLRQRSLYLAMALVVALGAVVVAIFFSLQARMAARVARLGELAAQSAALRDSKLDAALLLGVEVFDQVNNSQTRGVLLDNSQINPHLLQFLRGHTSPVNAVAFSPDGKIVASGSNDGSIILWDMTTRKSVGQPLTRHTGPIWSVAFSPDGKTLASGGNDQAVILWDVASYKPIGQPLSKHLNLVRSVAFSPDGKTLASASFDQTVILWDVVTHQPIGQPLRGGGDINLMISVAFSPDGKILASADLNKTILLWDVATHEPIGQPLRGHDADVQSVTFSPDGKTLASGSSDTTIILWEVATGRQISRLNNGFSSVTSVVFSPDGKTLASASFDQTLSLWDVATQRVIGQPFRGHTGIVWSVAFSPDGNTLASGSNDTAVILWKISSQPPIAQSLYGGTNQVVSVAYSPDGKTLASGSDDQTVILWDMKTRKVIGQPLRGHTDQVTSVAFSSDGKTLASGSFDKTVILWDTTKHQIIGEPLRGHIDPVGSVAFSPDGKTLASGSDDGTIILWDVASGNSIGQLLTGNPGPIWCVTFSPDGKTLASGDQDRTVTLWDVESHQSIGEPLRGHTDQLRSLAFSPDGKTLASGSLDQTIILWDMATHKPIGQPLRGHSNFVYDIAFSPDGKTLASASFDQTLILWDIAAHQQIGQPLRGHTSVVFSVAFSPDGKTLASGSGDQTVILWDLDAQLWIRFACQRAGRNFTRAEWGQYFPDEQYRATCSQWPLEPEAIPTPTP